MSLADFPVLGSTAKRMAAMVVPPFYGKVYLSKLNIRGFISPRAVISHQSVEFGQHIYIDDDVLIYQDQDGECVVLADEVHLHRYSILQTGNKGSIRIGKQTHIQPRCQLSSYVGSIDIGENVEIAPNCSFYSYDHGIAPDELINSQPLVTKGGIRIEDEVWLGVGVTVLDGVVIGKGAIIGAGSVVTASIPDNAIAVGVPAKVIKLRTDI